MERSLGFSLAKAATVTLTVGAETVLAGEFLEAGVHKYSRDFGPGDHNWKLTATFRTSDGNDVTLTRSGTVSIEQTVKKGLHLGNTVVKGVSLTNGSLNLSSTDLMVPGYNGGLVFNRTYNSSAGQNYSPMGIGWAHQAQTRLIQVGIGQIKIVGGDGSGQVFENTGTGWIPVSQGTHSRLHAADGGYVFTTKSGRKFIYGPALPMHVATLNSPHNFGQNLLGVEDPFGNRTAYRFSPGGLLQEITDPSGRKLVFHYNVGVVGYALLESVETVGVTPAILVSYEHDEWGRLIRVSRGERVETYSYTDICGDHKISDYTNPNGHTTHYTFHDLTSLPGVGNPNLFIQRISEPEGLVTDFDYGLDVTIQ